MTSARITLIPYRRWVLCFIALVLAWSGGGLAVAASDPGDFLLSVGQEAVAQLREEGLSEDEKKERFRSLLNHAVDVPTISRFVLGANWRRASAQEQQDFQDALEEMTLQRFLPLFQGEANGYDGRGLEIQQVRQSERKKSHYFVTTKVKQKQGPEVNLTWRIREKDGAYKILDITVEGVSMALTLREEFTAAVRTYGGVGPMIVELQKKIKAGAFKPK